MCMSWRIFPSCVPVFACRWSVTTCSVYLKCLVLASNANEVDWLISVLLPKLGEVGFENLPHCRERDDALFVARSWLASPQLRPHGIRILSSALPNVDWSASSKAAPTRVELIKRSRSAFVLAEWVTKESEAVVGSVCEQSDGRAGGADPDLLGGAEPPLSSAGAGPIAQGHCGLSLAGAVSSIAREARLPQNSADLTPSQFIAVCKKRRVAPALLGEYLEASAFLIGLYSKHKSCKPMASALRAWGGFCDLIEEPHFPVRPEVVVKFAVVCRDPGTFKCYVSHVKSVCEFLGIGTEWAFDPLVKRAKLGLKKMGLVYKPPARRLE